MKVYIKDRTVYKANRYIPCDNNGNNNNNDPESNIAVVAGVAPDLKPVELEYIAELSDPEDNCLYHADIPEKKMTR